MHHERGARMAFGFCSSQRASPASSTKTTKYSAATLPPAPAVPRTHGYSVCRPARGGNPEPSVLTHSPDAGVCPSYSHCYTRVTLCFLCTWEPHTPRLKSDLLGRGPLGSSSRRVLLGSAIQGEGASSRFTIQKNVESAWAQGQTCYPRQYK